MAARISIAILVIGAVLVGYALYNAIEVVEETTSEGFSVRALRNPFLAASQFLEHYGYQVQTSRRMKALDQLPEGGTVIISDARQLRKTARVDSLVSWMEQGGHLIVGAHITRDGDHNALLNHFGVSKQQSDCECKNDTDEKKKPEQQKKFSDLLREANEELKDAKHETNNDVDKKHENIPDNKLTRLYFEDINHPVKVYFKQKAALHHPALSTGKKRKPYNGPRPFYWEQNEAGVQFLQFHVGEGMLSVLSDSSIWDSRSIDIADHAFLLSILNYGSEHILIVYGTQMPTLFSLWRQYAPESLVGIILWLALWLWYRTKRFGGLVEPVNTVRRSLEEHVMATGNYLWRSKQHGALLAPLMASLRQKIERENPGFSQLYKQEQAAWVSKYSGLTPQEASMALYTKDVSSEDEFYRLVKLLQQLRNKL